MQPAWKLKLFFSTCLLAFSVYLLWPTFVYFSLSDAELREVRQDKKAFDKHLPFWAARNHIIPGLDLQGGIHLVLGVDIPKAILDKTTRTADRLRDFAKEQKATFKTLEEGSPSALQAQIKVTFDKAEQQTFFSKNVMDKFNELMVVYEGDNTLLLELDPNVMAAIRKDAVDQAIITIRSRIDKMGVTEPSISKRGSDQIQIQLPGYDDPKEAKNLIGRTAQLEFQMCDDSSEFLSELKDLPPDVRLIKSNYSKPDGSLGKDNYLEFPKERLDELRAYLHPRTPADNTIKFGRPSSLALNSMRTYTLHKKVVLTGDDLVDTRVVTASEMNPQPAVSLTFSPMGARVFSELTKNNIGHRMAIVLEDLVDSAPVFTQHIPNGQAQITLGGAKTREEMLKDANQLSLVLKSGALPAPVTFREERSVGPSLGADSVAQGQKAFLIGALLVMLLMIGYYRLAGFFSIIAVIFNVAFILAALAFMGATLTLPGVAGILLTIAMAVDANVIINERIREELRLGKTPRSAVKSGYEAAFSAVLDANVTTFIAGLVLWYYGSGPVQNFAMMLLVGTVSSVFTSVFISRIFFDMVTAKGPQRISI